MAQVANENYHIPISSTFPALLKDQIGRMVLPEAAAVVLRVEAANVGATYDHAWYEIDGMIVLVSIGIWARRCGMEWVA
jgi:hypothetical protein